MSEHEELKRRVETLESAVALLLEQAAAADKAREERKLAKERKQQEKIAHRKKIYGRS